ncbi:MAG: 3-oxoacyl-[acyl-carrier-protein] synthase III C-terminal domain-containing protein [Pseudomonadota bacterium]
MSYQNVYIIGTGHYVPGKPVDNSEIDDYIQTINQQSQRIKNRVLQENGIQTRYYGIDTEGKTTISLTDMAAQAVHAALDNAQLKMSDISLLTTGTVGGDVAVPGFANMLQGELNAPPMETSSHTGICASGVAALRHAADAIELKRFKHACVAACEFPSRMFKKTRFVDSHYSVDFDSHFLRWMLSDGAGSMILSSKPRSEGLSLKIKHIHTKSFSGDYPTCMQIGSPLDQQSVSYLDYDSLQEAEKDGSFLLRQNIRLLPQLFELCVHEYIELQRQGIFLSDEIDHFLCHYSSEKFASVVEDLIEKAGASIPRQRWYSNLKEKGNTGSASIFIMLDDFLKQKDIQVGQKILCFIPESARFTVAFIIMEVIGAEGNNSTSCEEDFTSAILENIPAPGHDIDITDEKMKHILQELSSVWHDYRSRFLRSTFNQKIIHQHLTAKDYTTWMENWIPQVREGSKWMRLAVSNLTDEFSFLKNLINEHASEEQHDWKILQQDYMNAGGTIQNPDLHRRNHGGEALNAFMYYRASQKNALDLLGGIYIIEGTGQRIIPARLPLIKKQLHLGPECYKFLQYHGENDVHHLMRWMGAVQFALHHSPDPDIASRIIQTAKIVADLYIMQLEKISL